MDFILNNSLSFPKISRFLTTKLYHLNLLVKEIILEFNLSCIDGENTYAKIYHKISIKFGKG